MNLMIVVFDFGDVLCDELVEWIVVWLFVLLWVKDWYELLVIVFLCLFVVCDEDWLCFVEMINVMIMGIDDCVCLLVIVYGVFVVGWM